MTHHIEIEEQLTDLCPDLKLRIIECLVNISNDNAKLWCFDNISHKMTFMSCK